MRRTTEQWEALLDGTTPPDDHLAAAVAEVIRLRRAIAAMRDECRRNAYLDSWLSQFGTAPLEPFFNEVADALTRILEGDNHA